MRIELSRGERAAVYAALVPGFRERRKRYPTTYRGGDSPDALAIDLERGWYDHARAEGGDCIAFAIRALDCDFRAACKYIGEIIGRDLLSSYGRSLPAYSEETLARAEMFRTGLAWRIDRALLAAKRELWGPRHERAAPVVASLTRWLETVRPPTELHHSEWSVYDAVRAMRVMDRRIVRECIGEAQQVCDWFAGALVALWSHESQLERAA